MIDSADRLPLSHGQEQLWFLDQLAPGQATYNVAVTHRLTGALDEKALQASLTAMVARFDSLRSTFHATDGDPYVLISPATEVDLEVVDLSQLAPAEREARFTEVLNRCVSMPFDLVTGPLYRYTLIRFSPTDHVLSQVGHHIVTDGWSSGLIHAELTRSYTALLTGGQVSAEPAPVRYADFARQQRALLASGELESQLEYWEKQLAALPVLELPADRSRPAEQSFAGRYLNEALPDEVLTAVRLLSQQQGVPLFVVLASAVAVLLNRYTDVADVPFGIATPGRTDPDAEEIVGLFTNMMVLRADLAGNPSFADLLERVTEGVLDAYDNQDVPFELVVQRVQPVRDLGRNPLFTVALQLIDSRLSGSDLDLPGLRSQMINPENPVSRFDLALNFVELPDQLRLAIEYSADLFDGWRIEAMIGHLTQLLLSASTQPWLPVSDLPMLTEPERTALLAAGTGEPLSYSDEPVHAVITRTAQVHPDHPAAVFEGRELSYRDLDRRSDQVARYLRANGVQHQQVVAVVMERDLDVLVATLGVLKAGAAFAVLDPANPASRLEFMLRDTATPLVLTQARMHARVPESTDWQIVAVDADWDRIAHADKAEPWDEWAGRDSLAYLLYTSGSTGQPKGVMIEHRALMSFIESYRRVFSLVPEDRMLQLAALSFDMSQGEIFAGLAVGSTLVLVDPDSAASPDGLATLMREQRTSYICMSPAMLSLVEAGPYPALRKIMAGGDAVPAELVTKWNVADRQLINCYGPTEATVGCTAYECPHEVRRTAPPIGTPFPDRLMYVVDRQNNLVPQGVPGELLIGGSEGLARGYLNQPELTAALFVEDPFVPGGRVYRSGDLVRWNRDFQLEFLGRADSQVKLRGLRIELEEIESALLAHPDVSMAAVALRPDRRGEPQLVGYVTPAGEQEPADLRGHLLDRLPEYMVPNAWVVLDRLPLTTARKVNRAALPDPAPIGDTELYVEPATDTERRVAAIFTEVLEAEEVGAESGFFNVGGSSLSAMRVVGRVNRDFGIKFTVRLLFGNPTVRGMAGVIDELVAAAR